MGTPATPKPRHLVRYEPHHERGPVMICLCGWIKAHPRQKVREDAALRHMAKVGAA